MVGEKEWEPADERERRLLFVSPEIVIVNKKCGELCSLPKNDADRQWFLPARIEPLLERKNGRSAYLECVNRIDRPVTGIVILGRGDAAVARMAGLLKKSEVAKQYFCIVEGVLPTTEHFVTLHDFIAFDQRRAKASIVDGGTPGSQEAVLRYRVFGAGERYSYLAVELLTGRTHQIRCQLAHYGMHIKGDLKYGAKRSEKDGGIRLHAARIGFVSPFTGERLSFSAPLWEEDALWRSFMEQLPENLHG